MQRVRAGCYVWPPVLQEHRGLLTIRYPMEHGVVRDWNDMERIWQYVYSKDQLQTFSEEVWYPPCSPHSQLSDCLSVELPVLCGACMCVCTPSDSQAKCSKAWGLELTQSPREGHPTVEWCF